jgi:hypothetical protein
MYVSSARIVELQNCREESLMSPVYLTPEMEEHFSPTTTVEHARSIRENGYTQQNLKKVIEGKPLKGKGSRSLLTYKLDGQVDADGGGTAKRKSKKNASEDEGGDEDGEESAAGPSRLPQGAKEGEVGGDGEEAKDNPGEEAGEEATGEVKDIAGDAERASGDQMDLDERDQLENDEAMD